MTAVPHPGVEWRQSTERTNVQVSRGRVLSLAAASLDGDDGDCIGPVAPISSAAAKAEGKLTTIALPHGWCGYGDGDRWLQEEVS